LLIAIIFFLPRTAYAHFTESDGSMAVTLHVDPNDDPIPGKKTNLYFLFKDTTKVFHITDCNCVVTVTEQGKQIFQKPLNEQKSPHLAIWGTFVPIVFPKNDTYHIAVSGKSRTQDAFTPFSVFWNFRVDPANPGIVDDDNPAQPSDLTVLIISWGIGIIAVVLIGFIIKKEIVSAETSDNKKHH